MIRMLLWVSCLLMTVSAFAQGTTYQYKRVKIVNNGVEKACNDDAHYITFVAQGCYESDNNGFTDNPNAFIKYTGIDNGIRCYHGNGYYGSARYYFSQDLSRLNLYVNDNLIYVYQRQPSLVASGVMRPKKTPSQPATPVTPGVTPTGPTYDQPQPYKPTEEYFREMYARWERNAKSAYDSLTLLGVDVKYKDGSREGSTLGTWQGSRYVEMKGLLNNAQREMRNVRMEANRYGYKIAQSHWETATVHI